MKKKVSMETLKVLEPVTHNQLTELGFKYMSRYKSVDKIYEDTVDDVFYRLSISSFHHKIHVQRREPESFVLIGLRVMDNYDFLLQELITIKHGPAIALSRIRKINLLCDENKP